MSLKYEPSSEPLHIYGRKAFTIERSLKHQNFFKYEPQHPAPQPLRYRPYTLYIKPYTLNPQRETLNPKRREARNLLRRDVLWYRGGLVFEAHRLLYHSA